MVDFSKLLRKNVSDAKRPPALPAADYPGIIARHELGDQNTNHTPYVRYHVRLTGPAETVDPAELAGIELDKRQMRRDFFLTDDADWRLAEFLKSCGIETEGRNFEDTISEAVGKTVVVQVQQYLNQKTNEIGNQIGTLTGTGA